METIYLHELNKIEDYLKGNIHKKNQLIRYLLFLAYGYMGDKYNNSNYTRDFEGLHSICGQLKNLYIDITDKFDELVEKNHDLELKKGDIFSEGISNPRSPLERWMKPNADVSTSKKTESYDTLKLRDLVFILVLLYKDKRYNKDKDKKITESISKDNEQGSNYFIRLLIYLFPDTGLPHYFYQGLSLGLNIELEKSLNWAITKGVLDNGHTDSALHSFSNAVALNKNGDGDLLFFPLFSFSGYRVIIKKDKIENIENFASYGELFISRIWTMAMENNDLKICAQNNTDLQWMAKKFCEKSMGNTRWNDRFFEKKIKDCSNAEDFIKDETAYIYVTNWVNGIQFENLDNYLVISEDRYVNHNNLNGIFFYSDFYQKSKSAFVRLMNNWYNSLVLMNTNFKKIGIKKSFINKNELPELIHIENYCKILSEELNTKIRKEDLKENLKNENVFFMNSGVAFEEFDKILNNTKLLNEYVELSNFNLGKFLSSDRDSITADDVKQLIIKSKKMLNEK